MGVPMGLILQRIRASAGMRAIMDMLPDEILDLRNDLAVVLTTLEVLSTDETAPAELRQLAQAALLRQVRILNRLAVTLRLDLSDRAD
jgi:hypothetical protein